MTEMSIGIDRKDRDAIVGELEKTLADTYTLYLETHRFHWNVEGPMFQTLHDMFEEQYRDMWDAVDELAERVRTLGRYAPGTYNQFTKLSGIEVNEDNPPALEMVSTLVQGHESLIRGARKALDVADEKNDQGTVDLLTQRIQFHEKTAWMLRSLLSGDVQEGRTRK